MAFLINDSDVARAAETLVYTIEFKSSSRFKRDEREYVMSNGRIPNIKYIDNIEVLISRHEGFSCLKGKTIFEYDKEALRSFFVFGNSISKHDRYTWDVSGVQYFNNLNAVSLLNAMFIGKTGYGKSSLLNRIIGKSIFPVDDINTCTKEVDTAIFRLGLNQQYYFALSDLPGVGESIEADKKYMEWYRNVLQSSECVVYALRADQRDFSIDETVFQQLFQNEDEKDKVVIALNFADKINPVSRRGELTEEQLNALEEKVNQVEVIFGIDSFKIVPCSAQTGYGMTSLVREMLDLLDQKVIEE